MSMRKLCCSSPMHQISVRVERSMWQRRSQTRFHVPICSVCAVRLYFCCADDFAIEFSYEKSAYKIFFF